MMMSTSSFISICRRPREIVSRYSPRMEEIALKIASRFIGMFAMQFIILMDFRSSHVQYNMLNLEACPTIFSNNIFVSIIRQCLGLDEPNCNISTMCILEGELLVYSDKVCRIYLTA